MATLEAEPGAIEVTGGSALVLHGRRIADGPGQIVVTGASVVFRHPTRHFRVSGGRIALWGASTTRLRAGKPATVSPLFVRVWQHLLPDGQAWRPLNRQTRQLERLVRGLSVAPERARRYLDEILSELQPATTNQLAEWERDLEIFPRTTVADRRTDIADALRMEDALLKGGQSLGYIEDKLRARGFDVYLHEWWSSGPPWDVRDPHDYAIESTVGTIQCQAPIEQPQAIGYLAPDVPMAGQPQCNDYPARDSNYLTNKDGNPGRHQPLIPDDPDTWRHFVYVGGESFPGPADVPAARREELEREILRLRPQEKWVVVLVNWT